MAAAESDLRANDLWTSVQVPGLRFDGLIYGLRHDFSLTETGLLVRDCHDRQIATIVYRMARRDGWIAIQAGGETFEADVQPEARQRVVLHPAADPASVLCTFSRLPRGVYRFESPSNPPIESAPPPGFHLAPRFEYRIADCPAGVAQHIGGIRNRGVMLVLPDTVPLAVRLFILAIQRQRF